MHAKFAVVRASTLIWHTDQIMLDYLYILPFPKQQNQHNHTTLIHVQLHYSSIVRNHHIWHNQNASVCEIENSTNFPTAYFHLTNRQTINIPIVCMGAQLHMRIVRINEKKPKWKKKIIWIKNVTLNKRRLFENAPINFF